jgi:hypothetical protein
MPQRASQQRPDLKAVPMLLNEPLYIGVDIGKAKHVAGFLSRTLLERHERFEACPALVFEHSREGFRAFVERMRSLAPLEHVFVLYVRYNQGTKQGLLPLPEPLRDRGRGLSFSLRRDAPWQRYAGNSIR